MSTNQNGFDSFPTSPPKRVRTPALTIGDIPSVDPFDGVRNPMTVSSVSHKVAMPYRTRANGWRPRVGLCDSAAEAACAHQSLVSPNLHDLRFQPMTVRYRREDGTFGGHTYDLHQTFRNGRRDFVFVRNRHSLAKPSTRQEIEAIVAATPKASADGVKIVDASVYTRARKENLSRMHCLVFQPDPEADAEVAGAAKRFPPWLMKDLFDRVTIPRFRVFRACYRLVAFGALKANLDHILWEYSRVEVA